MILGNIREPDVSLSLCGCFPQLLLQIGRWCPCKCVKALSPSNTWTKIMHQRQKYLASSCCYAREIDLYTQTAAVYTNPNAVTRVGQTGNCDGGPALLDFTPALHDSSAGYDAIIPTPPATP
jgi:hypothetical protein